MPREVEVKVRLGEPAERFRERLLSAGAIVKKPRHFEDNVLFDTPDRSIQNAGCLLRVRTAAGQGLLTYKAPAESSLRHKTRHEVETRVADPAALRWILGELGYGISFRYQKYRESFELGGCALEIDETPIANFLEIEGEPSGIDAVASSLGIDPAGYVLDTYAELYARDCLLRGVEPGAGMVFEP